MLVILRIAEVPLSGEKIDGLAGAVDVLRQGMAEEPFAPIAVLDAAADRGDALGLQLVAGIESQVLGGLSASRPAFS